MLSSCMTPRINDVVQMERAAQSYKANGHRYAAQASSNDDSGKPTRPPAERRNGGAFEDPVHAKSKRIPVVEMFD